MSAMRFSTGVIVVLLTFTALLSSCAPRTVRPAPGSDLAADLRAAFSADGVVWTEGGRACVARVPSFTPVCPAVGQVVDVNWHAGEAWAAIPAAGLVATLDRAPQTLAVGAVTALSANAIYRQDGSALSYAGLPASEVPGRPALAVTGGDGLDYVLLGGQLVRVSDGRVLDPLGGAFLAVTPTGVRVTSSPAVETTTGTYWLRNGRLERVDAAGQVLASVPHERGRLGLVGADLVTVSGGGHLRRFTADLTELPLGF